MSDFIIWHFLFGWDGGTWSQIICPANFRDPASLGCVRNPGSGLAQCRLALLTPDNPRVAEESILL